MNFYKFFFIANMIIMLIQTITIYLYQGEILWLVIMLLTYVSEIFVIIGVEQEKKKNLSNSDVL